MHPQAYEFVAAAKIAFIEEVPQTVVELGSFNVNGSVRPLFERSHYIGVDSRAGRDVDIVADATEWVEAQDVDLVVTTEMLEHCAKPKAVITNARKMLKAGGLFIATMAAPERQPHSCNGGPDIPDGEHYANIDPGELRSWLNRGWEVLDLQHYPDRGDLYVVARKK